MSDFVHGDQADVHHGPPVHDMEKDLEAGGMEKHTAGAHINDDFETGTAEPIRARKLQQEKNFLRTLRNGEEWLDAKMGIETQGIDRIKEEDKRPPSLINVFFLWWSLTCHVVTVPIGLLGPEFGLSLGQSVAAIVVGTMLGALCTAYTGTLGPKVSADLDMHMIRAD